MLYLILSCMSLINSGFYVQIMKLFNLGLALCTKDFYKLVNEFIEQEKLHLEIQTQHYEFDVACHSEFRNLSTIYEIC